MVHTFEDGRELDEVVDHLRGVVESAIAEGDLPAGLVLSYRTERWSCVLSVTIEDVGDSVPVGSPRVRSPQLKRLSRLLREIVRSCETNWTTVKPQVRVAPTVFLPLDQKLAVRCARAAVESNDPDAIADAMVGWQATGLPTSHPAWVDLKRLARSLSSRRR